MDYPRFERLTVYIMPRHLDFLNRRFNELGINRSINVREAMELLMAKYDDKSKDGVKPDEPQD